MSAITDALRDKFGYAVVRGQVVNWGMGKDEAGKDVYKPLTVRPASRHEEELWAEVVRLTGELQAEITLSRALFAAATEVPLATVAEVPADPVSIIKARMVSIRGAKDVLDAP